MSPADSSGSNEAIVDLHVSYQSRKECLEMGLDILPLRLRLIRVELETGQIEVLITSLTDIKKLALRAFPWLTLTLICNNEVSPYSVQKNPLSKMLDVKYSIASAFYDLDFIIKSFDKSTVSTIVEIISNM